MLGLIPRYSNRDYYILYDKHDAWDTFILARNMELIGD